MRRSTYILLVGLLVVFVIPPFFYDYRDKTYYGGYDESIKIAGESKKVKIAPVSVINVVVNDDNNSSYNQDINIEPSEGDSIECYYSSEWDEFLSMNVSEDTLTFYFDLDKIRKKLNAIGSFEVHTNEIYLKVPQGILKELNSNNCLGFVDLNIYDYKTDTLNVLSGSKVVLRNCKIGYSQMKNHKYERIEFIGVNDVKTMSVFLKKSSNYVNSGILNVDELYIEGSGSFNMDKINVNKVITDVKNIEDENVANTDSNNDYIELKLSGKKEIILSNRD